MTTFLPPQSTMDHGSGPQLEILADIHSLIQKVCKLVEKVADESAQHQQQGGGGGGNDDRRQKIMRKSDLRQCLRKLHCLLHEKHLDLGSYTQVYDSSDESRNSSHTTNLELVGLTDDLVQLMTLDCCHCCDDPSVIQLWKGIVPSAAKLLPTQYLNTDQIWRLFTRVLESIHNFDVRLSRYLYDVHNNTNPTNNNTDETTRTSMMTLDNPTKTTHDRFQWPPSRVDQEVFHGLLSQLIVALEFNPTYFVGILPTYEADEVLLRPLQFICHLTRLIGSGLGATAASSSSSSAAGGSIQSVSTKRHSSNTQDRNYGGLPFEIVVSLRLLVGHFLANLKSAVRQDSGKESGFVSLCEWMYQKNENKPSTSSSSSPSSNSYRSTLSGTDHELFFHFMNEYAMDFADEAIHLLHDVETAFADGRESSSSPPSDDGRTGVDPDGETNDARVFDALQYASIASNFFSHTENDGFYHPPKLHGLSRSLWHAVGSFSSLVTSTEYQQHGPPLPLEWETVLTETMFRLTQTQVSISSTATLPDTFSSSDAFEDKELTIIVTTILRLLDNREPGMFNNEEIVAWVDRLLKYSAFGHKLVLPLQASLLSVVSISNNYNIEKHDRLVSSLLALTGLRSDGGPQKARVGGGQLQTVNDIWKEYVSDQINGLHHGAINRGSMDH
jgi:hypothetical protein